MVVFNAAAAAVTSSLLISMTLGRATAQGRQEPLPPVKAGVSVHLSRAQAGVFQDAINSLAQQAHVVIVAEGVPMSPAPSNRALPDLTQDAPLEATLGPLGSAYDYSLGRSGVAVFVLKKRYTDPHDLPDVTLGECALAARDVVSVLSAFALDTDYAAHESASTGVMRGFMYSLTPEQMQALKERRLPFASLSERQQALVRNFVLYFYDQIPLEAAQPSAAALEQAPSASIGINQDSLGVFFGYFVKDDAKRDDAKRGKFVGFTRALTSHPDAPILDPAMALPPNWKALQEQAASPLPPTLGAEAEALSKRGPQRMLVDAALRAKTISIAGDSNASAGDVFKAMAAVYGLQISAPEKGTQRLARPLVVVPLQVTDIPDAIWTAVPEPFWRALHKGEKVERGEPQASETPAQSIRADQDFRQRQDTYLQIPATLRAMALQKLRLAAENFWRKNLGRRPVPVASLREVDRNALAVALMADCLGAVRTEYGRSIPSYILNLDQAVLRGGPYLHPDSRSKWKFSLAMTVPGTDGQPAEGPGGFDMPYFPTVDQALPPETEHP